MNLWHFVVQKGSCFESIYLRKIKTKTFYQNTDFCSPPSLHSSWTWMGQKILPKLYHNSTLCSHILKVKPTLSFGPLIICITFVGLSLGQCFSKKCNLLIIKLVVDPFNNTPHYCVNHDHEQVDQSAPGKNLR